MFQRFMMVAILFLSAVALAMAAPPNPVDGKWQGTVSGPNGDFTINFTFKADGTKLTGTVETPNGEQPISDGRSRGTNSRLRHNSRTTPSNTRELSPAIRSN